MDYLKYLDKEIDKANKVLTLVPKDEYLALAKAMAPLKEMNISKRSYLKYLNEK